MSKQYTSFLIALLLILSSSNVVAEFAVLPSATFNQVYISNIDLAPSGQEESDVMTQATPAISLTSRGDRLNVALDIRRQMLYSQEDSDRNSSYQQYFLNTDLELIRDLFFLDTDASMMQVVINPTESAGSIFDSADNLADRQTYNVSPYLRHQFGTTAMALLRYRFSETSYDDDTISDSESNYSELFLNNDVSSSRINWRLNYSENEIVFAPALLTRPLLLTIPERTVTLEQSSFRLSYRVLSGLSLFVEGGDENNTVVQGATEDEFSGSFDFVGFRWAPSSRTSLEAAQGERFFGDTSTVSFNYNQSNSLWRLNYRENVSVDLPDTFSDSPVQRVNALGLPTDQGVYADEDFNITSITANLFVEKSATGVFVQNLNFGTVRFEHGREQRSFLNGQQANQVDETEGSEINVTVNLASNADVTVYYERDEVITATNIDNSVAGDVLNEYGVSALWRMRSAMQVTVMLRQLSRDSIIAANEYDQTLLSLGVSAEF